MAQNATMAEFEALLNESFKIDTPQEGSVVKGKVIAIEAGFAIVDVGYKMEGRVELKEFANPGEAPEVAVGDEVEVFLRQVENAKGEAVISREMARREEAWDRLEKAYADDARVDGAIFGRVKGGFTVDLGGAVAFLPGSQVDVRPVRDAGPLMGLKQPFQILKMDRRRGNIVVSRRAILEESRAEQRAEVIGNLAEGDDVEGVVKNITEYGAFVNLGGVDGLLHVTDMAWRRINHPSEILTIGESIKVQVIKINKDTHRISLGMKQCQENPWLIFSENNSVGDTVNGSVKSITDFGMFVGLDGDIDGLVHLSDLSWTEAEDNAVQNFKKGQDVQALILAMDPLKERISLGIKQLEDDPVENFIKDHPKGTSVTGTISNIEDEILKLTVKESISVLMRKRDFIEDESSTLEEGNQINFLISNIDRKERKIWGSMKALEKSKEKEILKENEMKNKEIEESSKSSIGDLIKEELEDK